MNTQWQKLLRNHTLPVGNFPSKDVAKLQLFPLTSWQIVKVSGEERIKYLNSQLSNDLAKVDTEHWQRHTHSDPKGKLWTIYQVFHWQEQLFLISHKDALSPSIEQFNKYGVFAKMTVSQTEEWLAFGVSGSEAKSWLEQQFSITINAEVSALLTTDQVAILTLDAQRYQVIIKTDQAQQWLATFNSACYQETLWHYYNIIAGHPFISVPATNQYVAQQLNLQLLQAIDFEKGCYMGQEMIARMQYLGKNKRATFLLQGVASEVIQEGDDLQQAMDDRWRGAGKVLNVSQINDQAYLLAVMPNDIKPETAIRLKNQPDSAFNLSPLSYLKLDKEQVSS